MTDSRMEAVRRHVQSYYDAVRSSDLSDIKYSLQVLSGRSTPMMVTVMQLLDSVKKENELVVPDLDGDTSKYYEREETLVKLIKELQNNEMTPKELDERLEKLYDEWNYKGCNAPGH